MAAPIPAPPRSAPRRARLALAAALAVLALVAGCAAVDALTDLQGELEDEGFSDVTANISPTDASVVVISADAPRGTSVEEAQDQAAEVVWTRFPRRFDALRVTVDGERQEWTYAQLQDELGDRPDDLDVSKEIGDDLNRSILIAVLGMLAAAVVGIAVIGLIVLLAVRSNRRHAGSRPRPRPQPWMPPGVPAGGGPPTGTPVPPAGGWAPASAPPGPPAPPTPTGPPSLAKTPAGGAGPPTPPVAPPAPPAPTGRRPRDPDARRLGRRPRGPVPDEAHTPPGWG